MSQPKPTELVAQDSAGPTSPTSEPETPPAGTENDGVNDYGLTDLNEEVDWSKYVDTTWDLLNNDEEYVLGRLTSSYEVTASLAGFIGGFTFVVGNAETSFEDNDDDGNAISAEARREIFGFLVTISFMTSLIASMLASSFLVFVNICGLPKCKYFVKEFYFETNCCRRGSYYIPWTNVPWYLMNFSVALLIVATVVSVGGFYSTGVFVTSLLYLIVLLGVGMYLFMAIWGRMRAPDFGPVKGPNRGDREAREKQA